MKYGLGSSSLLAVDMGTHWAKCVLVSPQPDHSISFRGYGQCNSLGGMKAGVVVDMEKAAQAVRRAAADAIASAGVQATDALLILSGVHVRCDLARAQVPVARVEISDSEISQVLKAVQASQQKEGRNLLHTCPLQYRLDGHDGVRRPQGMAASRLEVDALVMTADSNICRNHDKVLRMAGLRGGGRRLAAGICAAAAVLRDEDRQSGAQVLVLDIGAGTTDMALFQDGTLQLLHVLPQGGGDITATIAHSLSISREQAESFKLQAGSVCPKQALAQEILKVPAKAGVQRQISHRDFATITTDGYRKILEQCRELLGTERFSSIVLTGGGAKVASLPELVEEVFDSPAHIGMPSVSGKLSGVLRDASCAALVGAARFALESPPPLNLRFADSDGYVLQEHTPLQHGWHSIKSWWTGNVWEGG